jgi:molecular chaperone GrpE
VKEQESMKRKTDTATNGERDAHPEEEEFKVEDKRHWTKKPDDDETDAEATPARPTIVDEYRQRAEAAEQKLHEYIDAFKQFKGEQEQVRQRLNRDIERKVELQFGEIVAELLKSVDDLDLALAHVGEGESEAVRNLANGVRMARDKFLETLERHGVSRMEPYGEAFDPNLAEAIRMDPVTDPKLNGTVTETLRPGYRLGDRIIRAAQVAVGRK